MLMTRRESIKEQRNKSKRNIVSWTDFGSLFHPVIKVNIIKSNNIDSL
jgi:hypothetical protein